MDNLLEISEKVTTVRVVVKWIKHEIAKNELELEMVKTDEEKSQLNRKIQELMQRTRLLQKDLEKIADEYHKEINRLS